MMHINIVSRDAYANVYSRWVVLTDGSNIKVDLKGLLIRDSILGRTVRNVPL